MSLVACISRCPATTRCPWDSNSLGHERLEHGLVRLLELEEEGVIAVAAEEEHHPGARPDAPDPHDLPGQVAVLEALEEVPAIALERAAVDPEEAVDRMFELLRAPDRRVLHPLVELADRDDQGWVGDDSRGLALEFLRHSREGPQAVLRPCLGGRLGEVLRLGLVVEAPQLFLDLSRVQPRVPDRDVAHRGKLRHRLAVGAHDGQHRLPPLRVAELTIAPADLEARGEALDIPLERAGMGLVEVVDVEDEVTFG
jgi:hypothetical protein